MMLIFIRQSAISNTDGNATGYSLIERVVGKSADLRLLQLLLAVELIRNAQSHPEHSLKRKRSQILYSNPRERKLTLAVLVNRISCVMTPPPAANWVPDGDSICTAKLFGTAA